MAQDRRRQEAERQETFLLIMETQNILVSLNYEAEGQLHDQPFLIGFAGKYKDNEAIEFSFDLNKDVPEDVAQEMVSTINNIVVRVGGGMKSKNRCWIERCGDVNVGILSDFYALT